MLGFCNTYIYKHVNPEIKAPVIHFALLIQVFPDFNDRELSTWYIWVLCKQSPKDLTEFL